MSIRTLLSELHESAGSQVTIGPQLTREVGAFAFLPLHHPHFSGDVKIQFSGAQGGGSAKSRVPKVNQSLSF